MGASGRVSVDPAGETSKNVRTTLQTLLGFAVKWGYLSRMPELPDVIVPESGYDWYQPGEVRQLLAAARDDWGRTVLLFALHTGVRMGEQRAVRWSDVDFEHRIITIGRSAPKWLSIEKNPKSNRHRRVDLTPELATALQGHPARRRAHLLQQGRIEATAGAVPRDPLGRAQEGGASSYQVARAPSLVCLDPHDGRRSTARRAITARSLDDQDDGALRPPRPGPERDVHAPARGDDVDVLASGPMLGPIERGNRSELEKTGPSPINAS